MILDPEPYIALHLRLSDALLRQLEEALKDPRQLYTAVVRQKSVKTGEETVFGVDRDTVDERKLCGIVDAFSQLKDIQRQALGLTDARDRLRYEAGKSGPDDDAVQGFLRALNGAESPPEE